uniref:Stromal cell-derived factor 1 n=1 Tax=Anser brachyrhynchus TaxID=132585 RepID=A0A8B9C303_9AVES
MLKYQWQEVGEVCWEMSGICSCRGSTSKLHVTALWEVGFESSHQTAHLRSLFFSPTPKDHLVSRTWRWLALKVPDSVLWCSTCTWHLRRLLGATSFLHAQQICYLGRENNELLLVLKPCGYIRAEKPVSLTYRCPCRFYESNVARANIKHLKILSTPNCSLQIVARLKSNSKQVCIDPKLKWIQEYLEKALNKRFKM